jgi:uncharacterized protein
MRNSGIHDDKDSTPEQAGMAAALAARRTAVLTTFRKDRTSVETPVSIAVDGTRIFFRSYATAGKVKRLRRNPLVELTPSTFFGKPRGSTVAARAQLLAGDDVGVALSVLARRHPVLQRRLVPWMHRLLRYTTVHYEITER